MNQGDIVIINFPYTNQKHSKVRPAVVISSTRYNTITNDVIVCGITSTNHKKFYSIPILKKDTENGCLHNTSFIRADALLRTSKANIRKTICKAKPELLARIKKQLQKIVL